MKKDNLIYVLIAAVIAYLLLNKSAVSASNGALNNQNGLGYLDNLTGNDNWFSSVGDLFGSISKVSKNSSSDNNYNGAPPTVDNFFVTD